MGNVAIIEGCNFSVENFSKPDSYLINKQVNKCLHVY